MKSQKSVGRAFTDVWEAFSKGFSHRNADFRLAGLLPTFGERVFATKRGKNLVRQAPWTPGAHKGVPLRRAQEAAGGPSWSRATTQLTTQPQWERTNDFTRKSSPRAPQRAPKNEGLLRKSASKTRSSESFGIRMRDGTRYVAPSSRERLSPPFRSVFPADSN